MSHDTLRAWERRYGLLRPERTAGGFRLYSDDDERRIRHMLGSLDDGLAPAEAARRAIEAVDTTQPPAFEGDPIAALRDALEGFHETGAHAVLDRLLATFELDSVLSHVVLPYLRDLGERWAEGTLSIAQEHFASTVLRARLLGLARGWDEGSGPRALLACPPGELHDLPLVCLGLSMRARGWRITLLGADTPLDTVTHTARGLRPTVCVVSATFPERLETRVGELRALAREVPLVLAGPGATDAVAGAVGGRAEHGDPVSVARRLTDAQRAA